MNPSEMKQLADLLQHVPGLRSIDIKDVNRLVELLRETPEVGSIEVKGWFGTGVVVTRSGMTSASTAPVYHAPPPVASVAPAVSDGAAPAAKSGAGGLKEIKSPMVGTFYKAPEPGAEPYAKVGTRISAGQTVCIIEAMKIMNEIEAEISGVIREVLVDDVHPVEFGQVLFRVDPNG
jgi:acetyl-CoA carboxylase biotin carboxyl carrier protein